MLGTGNLSWAAWEKRKEMVFHRVMKSKIVFGPFLNHVKMVQASNEQFKPF